MSLKAFLPSLLVLALSACAVGPDYKTPATEPANITTATDGAAGQKNFDRSRFEGIWWQQFEDPTLNQLVTQSLQGNRDLRVAFARWKAARAIRDDVSNDAMPTITSRASSDLGKGQIPGQTTKRVNSERYDLGLDMAWEIDLFGRIQRNLESADAEQQALEADLYQLQVTMIAELVDSYGQLRGAQLREKIALANLNNQQESRKITESLRDAGVGDQLDVERADARLASVEASVPQLQAEQVRQKNRIATLLGERPDKLTVDLSPKDLPAIAKALPIGDPGELLQRRPDIRSAERQLAAATAWALGPSITWAAFDLGSVRARLRGADAEAEGALATYEQQVLLALEESENAFSDYGKRQQRLISLIRQSESSRAAADLAQIRYREGTADFLVLLDAQRERLAAEDTQAQAEVDLYRGIVAIYKALGGGWQPETVASK